MSQALSVAPEAAIQPLKIRLYKRIIVLLAMSVVVCAIVIFFFGNQLVETLSDGATTIVDVALVSLLPCAVAAAVAIMTLLAVSTILPTARALAPSEMLLQRLRMIAGGDLSAKEKVQAEGSLHEISQELSRATGLLRMQINEMKIINRQQWETLGNIRQALERGNMERALRYVQEMEQTWVRTADLERRLRT